MNKSKAEVSKYLRSVINNLGQGKWYRLYPKCTIPPRLYGLPKIHKVGVPIRPIVDGIGSPPHELARFLANLLKPLTGKAASYIKNSYEFTQKVANIQIEVDDVLASLDVNSMYTNVPKVGALEITRQLLLSDTTLHERTNLSIDQIMHGIEVCLKLHYLVFVQKSTRRNKTLQWDL